MYVLSDLEGLVAVRRLVCTGENSCTYPRRMKPEKEIRIAQAHRVRACPCSSENTYHRRLQQDIRLEQGNAAERQRHQHTGRGTPEDQRGNPPEG